MKAPLKTLIVIGLAATGVVTTYYMLSSTRARAPKPRRTERQLSPPKEIGVDLSRHPNGGSITKHATPGTVLRVRLWARPPASAFRIVAEVRGAAATRLELAPAPDSVKVPAGLPPECLPVQGVVESLLAARRASDADLAERAMSRALTRQSCPQLAGFASSLFTYTRPLLPTRWELSPDGELSLTIEELASDGRVSATWKVTVTTKLPDLRWPHADEQEWLAASIVRDIVGLLSYAAAPSSPPALPAVRTVRKTAAGLPVVHVEAALAGGRSLTQEIALEPYVFAPAAYATFTSAAAAALAVRPANPETSSGLLDRLTDLRASTLRHESDRVAGWLSRSPLDPGANEEAALIHLALALRECAMRFSDIRASVARATAHLSIAHLASAPPGAAGRVAEAALQVLTGRQADVSPTLQAWLATPTTPSAERAWVRALQLRATEDWRIAPSGQPLTLLERLALYRARKASLGGLLALDMFEGERPETVPDWAWIGLSGSFSVQEGNMFATSAFPATLSEFAEVVLDKDLGEVQPGQVASALAADKPAQAVSWNEGRGTVQVLDTATWTGFFSRHLAHAAKATDDHMWKLGTPEAADAFVRQMEPYLNGTPWQVGLESIRQRDSGDLRPLECEVLLDWLQRRPEAVPALVWETFTNTCQGSAPSGKLPDIRAWFSGPAIPGTTVGLRERNDTKAMSNVLAVTDRLHSIAPYDEEVARVTILYGSKDKDAQAIAEAYGARKDYDLSVLRRLAAAERGRPERRLPHLQRLCEASVDECFELGDELAVSGDEAGAVRAYEHALKGARDRVGVCNNMDWLAAYYLETGKGRDAERVARAAADAYCAVGLELLGTVLERKGRLREAESFMKAIGERYDTEAPLDLFYMRAQKRLGGRVYEEKARRAMQRLFPDGLEPARISDFNRPPRDGVVILDDTPGVRKLGLARNDVIVALDGYRTRGLHQYQAVRGFRDEGKIELIVWSVARREYATAQGSFRNRRFGSRLSDLEFPVE